LFGEGKSERTRAAEAKRELARLIAGDPRKTPVKALPRKHVVCLQALLALSRRSAPCVIALDPFERV